MNQSGFDCLSICSCIATKEGMEMEETKEAGPSVWIWVVVIGIAAVLVATLVIFLRP